MDTRYSRYQLHLAILGYYNQQKPNTENKFNALGGRGGYPGSIEGFMRTTFTDEERVLAGLAFKDLEDRALLVPSYTDSASPGEWFKISTKGEQALQTGALDELDDQLIALNSTNDLIKLRYGAYDAIVSQHTDWQRHASASCRELITHVLHTIAPDKEVKNDPEFKPEPTASNEISRAERIRHYMRTKNGHVSKVDATIIQEACNLVEACYKKFSVGTHSDISEVKSTVKLTENALYFLLVNN